MSKAPRWSLPPDFAETLAGESMMEIAGWEPIVVTAMSDTTWHGRQIPIAWQIEIAARGGADGYALERRVLDAVGADDQTLMERCHSDTEAAACVLWVEDEGDCRELVERAWSVVVSRP